MDNIKDYLINKLFFPKVIVIDRPGIIINKTSSKYGHKEGKKRTLYSFEDILISLQLKTIRKIGRKRTGIMYYNLGKIIGTRYILSARMKRPPSFLVNPIIEHIRKNIGWTGISYNKADSDKNGHFVFKVKDIPVSRKTKDHSVFIGMFSAILGFIIGRNIEGRLEKSKDSKSVFYVFDATVNKRVNFDLNKIMPMKNYNKLNFPKKVNYIERMNSFSGLIKFRKVVLKERGKLYFKENLILPTTTEFLNIVASYYIKINEKDILEDGIKEAAEKIARRLLKDQKNQENKINTIKNMLCAFGWGIPYLKKEKNQVVFDILYPPISKYGFLYQALVINGYLNYIFNKKFKIKNIKEDLGQLRISIYYSSN